MAAGAGGNSGIAGCTASSGYAQALPPLEADDARVEATSGAMGEAGSEARVGARILPMIIEISDQDYRSFCFPCHALEEVEDCNDGY